MAAVAGFEASATGGRVWLGWRLQLLVVVCGRQQWLGWRLQLLVVVCGSSAKINIELMWVAFGKRISDFKYPKLAVFFPLVEYAETVPHPACNIGRA